MTEYHVYCLDVGHAMALPQPKLRGFGSHLEAAVAALSYSIRNRVLLTPKHEVALVLFGAATTEHDLEDESVLVGFAAGLALLQQRQEALRSESKTKASKMQMRLHLFTNQTIVSTAGEDDGSDHASALINVAQDLKLESFVYGIQLSDDASLADASKATPSHTTLQDFGSRLGAQLYNFGEISDMLKLFRKRVVKPAAFNVNLRVANVEIPVSGYDIVKRATVSTFKKLSNQVEIDPSDGDSGKVQREVTYHLDDEMATEIQKDDRQRAYRYGSTLIPWPEEAESNPEYKVEMEKQLTTLYFAPAASIPRHVYMGDSVKLFIPKPGSEPAVAIALDALVAGMEKRRVVAIVAYVYNKRSSPKLGMLFPRQLVADEDEDEEEEEEDGEDQHEGSDGHGPATGSSLGSSVGASAVLDGKSRRQRALHFVLLPFQEDARHFGFPSLKSLINELHCQEQATPATASTGASNPNDLPDTPQAAMDAFVSALDLMNVPDDQTPSTLCIIKAHVSSAHSCWAWLLDEDGDPVEALEPEDTFNPAIQMYNLAVPHRVLHPGDQLPAIDPEIVKFIEPHPYLAKKMAAMTPKLTQLFPLKINEVKTSGKRNANDLFGDDDGSAVKDAKMLDTNAAANILAGVTQVGSSRPVEDYEELLQSQNFANLEAVSSQLADQIFRFVDLYMDGDLSKFVAMVEAMRRASKDHDATVYNAFLMELKDRLDSQCETGKAQHFTTALLQHNLGLITVEETNTGGVSQDQASSFLSQPEPSHEAMDDAPPEDDNADEDDLDDL
ncbi:uncharacterized protein MONBRDRAFT_29753 [Monosiga brevicollis MX1]|uniref:Ku domain-containing protein n=1 Tax=Monosiga brevicollis TaxID=81824 RepID=A9VC10_MONBE|nr:uncharacterized protein MONBRDRAFT_29753 [Monosiga brevicollis MX1]EDQ84944.1 predicted protein [Monosiga brevicollis MX1]|eukprot:XP_001750285.1 hypothetical protein [Monosiga brevicollis MX1]